ncbi:hypothetical protein SY86_21705 [Erwinia tracheiphila]|uniref:Uncharacterized protein n=1 Tax=Erwinia tracheiphila TaxID=65700 RepID=A0A0M2KKB3_9GAMM|nr:hypothetical protein AV903_24005 [Erwinia tracheiphila]KKF37431.1 hypothetical protein SY86_21705 [Erwinia tracheiphila]
MMKIFSKFERFFNRRKTNSGLKLTVILARKFSSYTDHRERYYLNTSSIFWLTSIYQISMINYNNQINIR